MANPSEIKSALDREDLSMPFDIREGASAASAAIELLSPN